MKKIFLAFFLLIFITPVLAEENNFIKNNGGINRIDVKKIVIFCQQESEFKKCLLNNILLTKKEILEVKKNKNKNLEKEINFPDKNLEKVIREIIKKPSGNILKSDVLKIKNLQNTSHANISNLKGIENLENLEILNLDHNLIKNIEPIKNLKKITGLVLSQNEIEDISVLENLTNLEDLNLSENILNDDDLKHLKNLEKLRILVLNMNFFREIEILSNLKNLEELVLRNNYIQDISVLSNFKKLKALNISYNNVKNIDVIKNLPNLIEFHAVNNPIKNVSFLKEKENLGILNLLNTNVIGSLKRDKNYEIKEYEIFLKKIDEILSRIIKTDMNNFEKELAIHDFIIDNVEYDYVAEEEYEKNDGVFFDENMTSEEIISSFNAKGALINKKAVCGGYSDAFDILLKFSDIETKTIYGCAMGFHGWNLVKLDDDWYHVDVTFDDEYAKENDKYRYFNRTDEEMKNRKWIEKSYPKALGTKYRK